MAKEPKPRTIFPGHIVKDFYEGNTHIIICDDYCRNTTEEETKAILGRIAEIARRSAIAAAIAEQEKAETAE